MVGREDVRGACHSKVKLMPTPDGKERMYAFRRKAALNPEPHFGLQLNASVVTARSASRRVVLGRIGLDSGALDDGLATTHRPGA